MDRRFSNTPAGLFDGSPVFRASSWNAAGTSVALCQMKHIRLPVFREFEMPTTTATRLEHDLLGDKAVPADAYYGVQTARALENFHISGVQLASTRTSSRLSPW